MRHLPATVSTPKNGVRTLGTKLPRACPSRSMFPVSTGGWHYHLDSVNIPGGMTLTILGALKGPRGRRHTTRGEEILRLPWP